MKKLKVFYNRKMNKIAEKITIIQCTSICAISVVIDLFIVIIQNDIGDKYRNILIIALV